MSTIQLQNRRLQEFPSIPANITDIRVENNQLSEIPDSVATLTSLERIRAKNNHILKISNKLSSLNKFIDLGLEENKLQKIPESILNLKNLKILLLNNNTLKSIPNSIKELNKLVQLHLQDNQLETLPEGIGRLADLTHLYLTNNPIERLPQSIKKCTKLAVLDLTGTKLPLPTPYNIQNVQETIKYVLENQKESLPELNIKKYFVFKNFSKPELNVKFDSILEEYSNQIKVEFENITNLDSINESTTVVLIIIGFDVHEDQDLIFEIIKKCDATKVRYKIIFQKDISNSEDIHIEKGSEIKKLRDIFETKYKQDINPFNSDEEFKSLILSALKQHSPEIRLTSLELINIGHFENTTINFDDKLTCLIGENGQGKSSILRALSLSIVGLNTIEFSLKDLLRIESITEDGQTSYCKLGKIKLNYFVDSKKYCNEITLTPKDEGRIVDAQAHGDFEINSSDYNLKSLIVGFPQLRGRINHVEKPNKYSQPHINDLIPLIKNTDDSRLDSFISWIANLYGEARKSDSPEETREFATIKYVFEIISDLTGKEMVFSTVQQFSPPIVIVTSYDSPNGIPLNLISQGFKIVIGWIGYFIERKIEAFPLSSPENSTKEKSILIIDEIDSSIHPVWQTRLLSVLRERFPNTQIICTTHSPLMVAGLDRNQILEIKNIENQMTVNQCAFDTWVTTYREILKNIFHTKEYIPEITIEDLKRQLEENKNNPDAQLEIKEKIERLQENQMLIDDNAEYERRIIEKEKELDDLIIEYTKKASK